MTFQSKSKLICVTRLVLASMFLGVAWLSSSAQTNTFPSSGNAGIGTTAPTAPLEVKAPASAHSSVLLNTTSTGYAGSFFFQEAGVTKASIQHNPSVLPGALLFNTNGGSSPANTSMVINASGHVGIGTTSPNQRLSVAGTGAFYNSTPVTPSGVRGLFMGNFSLGSSIWSYNYASGVGDDLFVTAQNLSLNTYVGGNSTNRMYISNSGNVGIGTTAPAGLLDLKGNNVPYVGQLRIASNDYGQITFYDGVNLAPNGTNRKSFIYHDVALGTFNIGSTGNILIGPSNVGINRPSPTHKLDVGGLINSTQGLCIAGDCKTAWSQVGGGGGSQWTTAGTSVYYTTGGVGIGTQSPGYQLDVQSNAQWAARFKKTDASHGGILIDSAAGYNPNLGLSVNGTIKWFMNSNVAQSDSLQFWESTGQTPRFTLTQAGNVGIGTPGPTYRLQVSGNGGTAGDSMLVTDSNATSTAVDLANTSAGGRKWRLQTVGSGVAGRVGNFELVDIATNAKTLVVQPNGNVGIGTTSPTQKLHVAGDIQVDGNINAKYQDLAEWVPSAEQLSAGTVVVLDATKSNHVVSSSAAYDTRVAGVISARPGITLGEGGEGKVLVATTGRVRVKVDASRGPIQAGDLLVTSDVTGVAMKSEAVNLSGIQIHRPGTIIGKALEPLAKGKGEILVLLSLQ